MQGLEAKKLIPVFVDHLQRYHGSLGWSRLDVCWLYRRDKGNDIARAHQMPPYTSCTTTRQHGLRSSESDKVPHNNAGYAGTKERALPSLKA